MYLEWMECGAYGKDSLRYYDGERDFYGGVPWVAVVKDADHNSEHVARLPIGAAALWNDVDRCFDEVVELRGLSLEEKKRALETIVRMGV
jgi:hypothetical protein